MKEKVKRPTPLFSWFIPIDGDGTHIGTYRPERSPTFEYLRKVVEAAENGGFHSLLIPTRFVNGLFEEAAPLAETWTMATALAAVSNRIRFLIAVRPGFISPGLFAQMASSLDRISGGRIDINIVPGGIQGDFERLGEMSDHSNRYERAEEFIEVCRQLWKDPEHVTYNGRFIKLNKALVSPSPIDDGPKFYLGGASKSALALAGRQSDVYLAWIQPIAKIARHLELAREHFRTSGRNPVFGLRSHLVMRDTEGEAWDAADELISQADNVVKEQRKAVFAGTTMVGQREQLHIAPNHRLSRRLWNGISTVRVNCGTALVGTPEQIGHEILQYWRLGIDEFILSGFPHVEECERTIDKLIPVVRTLINRERCK